MNGTAWNPSFFELRWELFCTAEIFRQLEDTDYLWRIQKNIVDNELGRVSAATEAQGTPSSDSLRPERGLDAHSRPL
jgi:hypothetical protein